jgi:3-methyladenine DNA glycosylase Tag
MAKAPVKARAIPFKTIRARAEKRKGGAAALEKLLPPKPNMKALAKMADDRLLAEMTQRVFSEGFAWSVIENKWPDFEKAFLGFKPAKLIFQPDDFWDALLSDARIVRNGAKISSVRENAAFVQELAKNMAASAGFLAYGPPPTRSVCSIC